jgi:hypothetical protein
VSTPAKRSPLKIWFCAAAAEFSEGLADGFIIVAGGSQAAQIATDKIRAVSPQELLSSILLAGIWYVAAFVKKNPPPFGQSSLDLPAQPISSS